jgi:hypothetical protein
MTIKDISWLRLANQHILNGSFNEPKDLAGWMGAMQAQDFTMVKWAIGLRLPGAEIKKVEKAIEKGEIIRSHLLRPTWHFVSSDDFHWMLELSSPRIKPSLKYRQDFLGLTPKILADSNHIIAETLGGNDAGRDLIASELRKGGINPDDNRLSHILLWAELSGIVCSGKSPGDKQTYALISDRIPEKRKVPKEEALRMLAVKYFRSHGPATIRDFSWWSGLTSKEIKIALEKAEPELENETVDRRTYWFGRNHVIRPDENSACLLPAFDEFIISYSDRSAVLSLENHKKAVSQNGIFRSVVIIKNQVAGLWKAVKNKDLIILELSLFKKAKRSERSALEEAAEAYGKFLGKKIEVIYNS